MILVTSRNYYCSIEDLVMINVIALELVSFVVSACPPLFSWCCSALTRNCLWT